MYTHQCRIDLAHCIPEQRCCDQSYWRIYRRLLYSCAQTLGSRLAIAHRICSNHTKITHRGSPLHKGKSSGGCCRTCFQGGARSIRTGRSGANRVRECVCLGRKYKNQVGMARKKQGRNARSASKTVTQPVKRGMTPPRKFPESSVILPLTGKAFLMRWRDHSRND